MSASPHETAGNQHHTMTSQLAGVIRREPVTVAPGTSLQDALQAVQRHRLGSVVIMEPETGIPQGIFTTHDLLRIVASAEHALDQPIDQVMTRELVMLGPKSTAYEAALLMAQKRLRHVLVVGDDKRLLGVVSQNDLFALQRVGIKEISGEISTACDMNALAHAAEDIRLLADNMLAQGVGAEQLTHFISTLNDLLTLRLIELTRIEFNLPDMPWCWIALGSEGRFEQTFSSDQDNGLVFDAPDDLAEETRSRFLPFAQEVNRKLDRCGFLLCKGNIMAGNPMWCLSCNEWQKKFAEWMASATPQAILNASIFFDFRSLYGDHQLASRLRQWLLGACRQQTLFLRLMAQDALKRTAPLGMFGRFIFDKSPEFPRTVDLKMHGAWLFVDSARVLSLANGVAETSTTQRMRGIYHDQGEDGSSELSAMVNAFYFIQLTRLRHQHTLRGKAVGANRINPYALNEFDQQMLREALQLGRKFQRKLKLAYQL